MNIRINIMLLNIRYNFELMKEDSNYASFFLPILLSDIVGFVLLGICYFIKYIINI
jgi:hypothetical protein